MNKNRALKAFFLALLVVSLLGVTSVALAQTPTYPVPTGPQVAPSGASVLGTKFTRQEQQAAEAEVLPLTGGDAVGLALLAGMLIALGTAMNLRRKKPRAS